MTTAPKPNAIVVEDWPSIAERIQQMLEEAGFEVVGRIDTEDEALRAIERTPIDFAVIDLQLAQGTGFGIIRQLRKIAKTQPVCIVVLTNHAVPALKVASFEAGADYFLDKARDFNTLPRLAREIIAERENA